MKTKFSVIFSALNRCVNSSAFTWSAYLWLDRVPKFQLKPEALGVSSHIPIKTDIRSTINSREHWISREGNCVSPSLQIEHHSRVTYLHVPGNKGCQEILYSSF